MSVEHLDGSSACLLDIPNWDFHWQGGYGLTQPMRIVPGDAFRIECHWDNSASNQPVIDGQLQAPRDLNWGERTTDEMCVGFMYITRAGSGTVFRSLVMEMARRQVRSLAFGGHGKVVRPLPRNTRR